ncbi:MAG: OmpA family protein [Prolixibacteraceae bacterium]|nr:OmpA family protein [Prolixibacteraceae bacterium]
MIQKILFVLLLGCIYSCSLFTQGTKTNKSNEYFEKGLQAYQMGQYHHSIELLRKSIDADSLNVNAYLLMSDVASDINDNNLRLQALETVIQIAPERYPLAEKLLAESYARQGDFEKAIVHFKKYSKRSKKTDSVLVSQNIDRLKKVQHLVENPVDANIERFGSSINTSTDEYWPFPSADDSTLYFTRIVQSDAGYPIERLYYADRYSIGWQNAHRLAIGDRTEVNEGTMSMTANGNLIFFTACGRPDGMGSCDIYYLLKTSGKWIGPINAGPKVNTGGWDAQPSVSADGRFLFLSSNREGGFGKQDIWMCPIGDINNNTIEFCEVVNLGKGVNTPESDFSPFIHADNRTLYFASSGHYGMGGSDLFISRFQDKEWGNAKNLGYPVNSIKDDDGLVVSPTAHLAVFSSNRQESLNQSKDLYFMKLPADFMPHQMGYLKGYVYNKKNNKKIFAEVELSMLGDNEKQIVESDKDEGYLTVVEAGRTYALNVSMRGYLFYSRHFDYDTPESFTDATIENIFLEPIQKNAKVILNNIFFEFDSYELKNESETELKKVIDFMKENPTVEIEISGHTDTIGSEDYNLQLSKKRAGEIADFLSQYIDLSRIKAVGYGSSMPISSNETEQGRQKNRRSELRVIDF